MCSVATSAFAVAVAALERPVAVAVVLAAAATFMLLMGWQKKKKAFAAREAATLKRMEMRSNLQSISTPIFACGIYVCMLPHSQEESFTYLTARVSQLACLQKHEAAAAAVHTHSTQRYHTHMYDASRTSYYNTAVHAKSRRIFVPKPEREPEPT